MNLLAEIGKQCTEVKLNKETIEEVKKNHTRLGYSIKKIEIDLENYEEIVN